MGLSSNDNFSLNDEERRVQVAADDAGITWGWQSDQSQLSLEAQNHFRRYAGETGDADDLKTSQSPELALDWSHKPSARSDLGVALDYQKDRTAADEYRLNEQVQRFYLDKLDVDKERERMNAALNASYLQTEHWQWFGRFDATDLQYRKARDTQLLSYQDTGWSGGTYYMLHENWDVYWQGAYSTFLPSPDTRLQQFNATRSRTKSLSLGVRARFEDGVKLNLSLGSRRTVFDNPFMNSFDKGRGTVASLDFSKPFEFGQWQITASRALQPDGTGEIVERDNVSVSVRRNQTERLIHDLSWSWNHEQSPEVDAQADGEELNRIWAWQLSYRVTETHTFGVGLQHQQINRPARDTSNRIELNWRWNGLRQWY